MAEKTRLHYVDWLRVLVILCLIPYHAALTYSGTGDVYIKTPLHDALLFPFLSVAAPLDSFMMSLLFFLSGFSTFYSMGQRGQRGYLRERVRKVLLPFVLGTLLLCPVQAYFQWLQEGFTGSVVSFLPVFFSGQIVHYLGYAHLWFLLYLFIFSLAFLPLFSRWSKQPQRLQRLTEKLSEGNRILLPILFIVVAEFLLRPFFPGKQTFVTDLANVVVYGSLFVFGYVFATDERLRQRVLRLAPVCRIVAPVLAVFYIVLEYFEVTRGVSFLPWAFTKGIYECAAIVLCLWLGSKYLNRRSPALAHLSKGSFRYYLFHFIPVSSVSYLMLQANVSIFIKYLVVVLSGYLFVFAVNGGWLALRKLTLRPKGAGNTPELSR